jgi:hypothetical protein
MSRTGAPKSRKDARMERTGARMRRKDARMRRKDARMRRYDAGMERKISGMSRYEPRPCGSSALPRAPFARPGGIPALIPERLTRPPETAPAAAAAPA